MGKAWLKAHRRDRYYRQAKREAYRSRAAIKLAQIDDRFGLFRAGDIVVDLGAAPGGWSQVARERVGTPGRVIAVDQVPLARIEGVEFLRGDFAQSNVRAKLFEILRKPADVVMSDMAPKLSGAKPYDVARTLDLAQSAFEFAVKALRPGGTFLVKVFEGEGFRDFLATVSRRFDAVKAVKPPASAGTSAEIYVLAKGRD